MFLGILLFVFTCWGPLLFSSSEQGKVAVSIGTFENKTENPDLTRLGNLAAKWITAGLEGTDLFTVATGSARAVISGELWLKDSEIVFNVYISDSEDETRKVSIGPTNGGLDNPLKGIDFLREKVMGALAVMYDPWFSYTDLSGPLPVYAAYLESLEGAKCFSKFDYRTAINHFEKAQALDPEFPSPLISQYWAYGNLGDREGCNSVAAKLIQLSPKLGEMDGLQLKLVHAAILGNNFSSLEVMRKIVKLQGYSINGYRLGLEAYRANYPLEAVKAFEQQNLDAPFMENWKPAWYGQYSNALHMVEDYEKELEIGRSYAQDYPQYQFAYVIQGRSLVALGRIAEVDALIEKVTGSKEIGGVPANFVRQMGLEFRRHGYPELALKYFEYSISLLKSMKPEEQKNLRTGIFWSYYVADKWDEAEALAKELAQEFPEDITHLGRLGAVAARKGDVKEAKRIFNLLGETKDPRWINETRYRQSLIASILGEKETAVNLIKELLENGWDYGPGWYVNTDYEPLRDYEPFKKLFAIKG